jgi:hypothetical protein
MGDAEQALKSCIHNWLTLSGQVFFCPDTIPGYEYSF